MDQRRRGGGKLPSISSRDPSGRKGCSGWRSISMVSTIVCMQCNVDDGKHDKESAEYFYYANHFINNLHYCRSQRNI